MKKKIIQSKLTKNNDFSKTKETEKVLENMEEEKDPVRVLLFETIYQMKIQLSFPIQPPLVVTKLP